MRNLLIIITMALLFNGCAFNSGSIYKGMSEQDVYSELGRPDTMHGDISCWESRLVNGWSWDKGTYCVEFFQGNVVGYGWDNVVRQTYNSNFSYSVVDAKVKKDVTTKNYHYYNRR